MVFHWSLSGSKSPQVSRIYLSFLADLYNAVFWMVSTRHYFTKSSSPCTKPSVNVLSTLITIGIAVSFMIHSFFSSLARSRYLSLFSLFFIFTLWSAGTTKSTIQQVLFVFCWLSLVLVVLSRINDLFVSQNPREFCESHFLRRILGYYNNDNYYYCCCCCCGCYPYYITNDININTETINYSYIVITVNF